MTRLSQCRLMVKKPGPLVEALSAGHAPERVCASLPRFAPPSSVKEHAHGILSAIRLEPVTVLKLLPLLVTALALPSLILPLLRGPPPVPEPRYVHEHSNIRFDTQNLMLTRNVLPTRGPPLPDAPSQGPLDGDDAPVGCLPAATPEPAPAVKKRGRGRKAA